MKQRKVEYDILNETLPFIMERSPTEEDLFDPINNKKILVGQIWIDKKNQKIFQLIMIKENKAIWEIKYKA